MLTINLKFIEIIISFSIIFRLTSSEEISISPYLNAFKLYQKTAYFKQKSYAYINPSVHNFNVTIKLGDDIKKKEFIKSDMTVTIHTDRHQYYDLEKTDSYTINSICKFNYSPDVIYHYRNICCRITIQDFNFTRNDFYSIKLCKFTLSRYSSACFVELNFLKSFITKTSRADHFYFGLRAFAFATNMDECNMQSDVKEILAVSKLYPLSFSNGLSVFWTNLFQFNTNLSLEIGRPFYSLDPDSSASIPVKLVSDVRFSTMNLKCVISDNLEIKSVLFDENVFEAVYEISVLENELVVTIMLQNKGSNYQKSTQWWVDKGTLLFIMSGHLTESSTYSQMNLQNNAWIKCQILSFKQFHESKTISVTTGEIKKIPIAINTGKFIIIPILKNKSYFSIFNDMEDPITLDERFITLYSIHNVRDGSFVDVTNTATCDSVDKNSIICPTSMIKSVESYFDLHTKLESDRIRSLPNKLDLIIQMKTWKSVIFSPIDLWIAQDWRLEISDRIINKINGWRIPVRSVVTKTITCVMMYQKSNVKILARLANRNAISEKEYYGSSHLNDSPLLDITSQIQKESIEFSSPNNGMLFDEKTSDLIVDPQSGYNDVDVRLLALNSKRLLAIERVKISLEQVTIIKIKTFCVSSIDLYQDKKDRLSNYRHLLVEYSFQNDTKKHCYLFVVVVFSDLTEIRLDEMPIESFRVFVTQYDYVTNRNIETAIMSPVFIRYSNTINISIYESHICKYPKIIFSGVVKVNYQKDDHIPKIIKSQTRFPTRILTDVNQATTNVNIVPNKELLKNLSSLYYGLYALIALVSLVALIVLINCVVKFNYRKISHQSTTVTNQSVNNKLLNSSQTPPIVDTSSPSFSKHPPLLPPPGPLRNASDSEVELASSTFWSNCSSQDSTSFTNRKYSSTVLEQNIPISPLNNFLMRSSPLVSSVYANPKYRHNPSPSSDQGDGGYLSGENQSKFIQMPLLKKLSDDRNINLESLEINNENAGLTHYPEIYPVPPCPPLKWSIQWAASMVSALPVLSQSYTPNLMTDSTCVITRAVPSTGSSSSMSQWLTNKTIPSSISVPYTKSIDNLCEKSSGLGSLTSTQQEDYSMLSDDDNYHVSINSDKEHYRKYLKKC